MSKTIDPIASLIGRPAPSAAATGSSIKYTFLAPAPSADSLIALLSTCVAPEGTHINTRGPSRKLLPLAFLIKYCSIFSVVVKSAITPSFNGRIVSIFAGVLPSIVFASKPTALTLFLPFSSNIETTEGSSKTKPLFLT